MTLPNRSVGFIGGLESVRRWELVVDSGAEVSAWPRDWFSEVPVVTKGVGRKLLVAANWQEMGMVAKPCSSVGEDARRYSA